MSTNDYVKFMTQEIVRYMDMPQDEKKERKRTKQEYKEPVSYKMFGMLPFALKTLFKKR
ncbi:YqzE family protein [Pontibacillus salicampi]|uniref:YqzE family protein n=1 Tax=Pontibacillus salicampi TaxID=1449801 RepID=A0ABV6LJV5_9BACI